MPAPRDPYTRDAQGRFVAPLPAWHRYISCCRLFALNGYWPTSRTLTRNAKGFSAHPREPEAPPALSERQIDTVNEILGRRGWVLVRVADGSLRLVRTI